MVSRDSVRTCLLLAALNDLKVLSGDIENAYLTAPCREKCWTIAGKEFGSDQGKPFIIEKALYGLKSSGAAFRAFLRWFAITATAYLIDPETVKPDMK